MINRPILAVMTALAALSAAGCSSITGSDPLEDFVWIPIPSPESVVPEVEATSAVRLLYVQGTLQTPSPCYDLSGNVGKAGGKITLRVRATPGTGTNCAGLGAFRYWVIIGDLALRTYELHVIHEVRGGDGGTFTLNVTVID